MGDVVRVDEVFDLRMGKTPPRKNLEYWNTGDVDWVSIGDLSSFGRYVGKTKETISDQAIVDCRMKAVPANTPRVLNASATPV